MGYTGLARWQHAPTTGLDMISDNIVKNHHGQFVGRWQLSIRSYRSSFVGAAVPNMFMERSMFTLTMGENAFVLIDDPGAPSPQEWIESYLANHQSAAPPSQKSPPTSGAKMGTEPSKPPIKVPPQPHYRYTFVTVRPNNALEHILQQLRARWSFSRQSAQGQRAPLGKQGVQPPSLNIDGSIFALGKDWLVRIGNVSVSGGMKGMVLEAEYRPLPTLPTGDDHSSVLVSNLLMSLLPINTDARAQTITLSDAQWKEVFHDTEAETEAELEAEEALALKKQQEVDLAALAEATGTPTDTEQPKVPEDRPVQDDDDVFIYADEHDAETDMKKDDWDGLERDRRSAFMIIMGLRTEGIV